MNERMRRIAPAMLIATLLWLAPALRADVTGAVLGSVTDPSGAAVPGAKVTLHNPDTGFNRTATTDTAGSFEFMAVPVGDNYTVEVEAQGFQKSSQSKLKLLVNQRYRADFQLVVGAISQSVNVSAEAAQVETTSTQLGDVIEDKKMTTLPLNGRSYIDLLGLQAGVVPIGSSAAVTDRPVSGIGNAGNISVNGQREAANSFLINGGDVEEGRNNGASIVPVLDSIQEFRLITNSFDAEYGRFSGAIVNAITKSGTNTFHGTAFEFLRNDKLDSRGFFDYNQADPVTGQELAGTARGALKRNQFGGVGGGPILKNRLFFFSDYQGTRQVRGVSSGQVLVPSLAERTGDFSDADITGFPALTGIVRGDNIPGNHTMDEVLSQRLPYTVTSGEPYWVDGCNTLADAQAGMCVFPGQVIPQSAWSPVPVKTLKFIPNPIASINGAPFFSTTAEKETVRDDKWAQRIDFNNQLTGNWAFYYHFDDAKVLRPFPAVANVPGFPAVTPSRAQQFNVSNTRNFGATAVNEARFNFTRSSLTLNKPTGGLGKVTDFGYVSGGLGIIPVDPAAEGVALTCLYGAYGDCFGLPDGTTGQFNNTFQATENFSKIVGKHTLKFGGEFRYFQINERNTYTSNGYFEFYGNETGNDFADYLIGAPDLFNQSSRQFLDSRTRYGGIYGQDTFKIKPNLTLNYGLRWEVSQPFYDTQGKTQAFVPGLQSKVYPDAPTGWVFPGDPGIPKTLSPTHYNNFGPRLGFAYSPSFSDGVLGKIFGGPGKTSIRGAAGIYYTAIEDLTLFIEVGDAPFGLFYVSPTEVYMEEPYKDRRHGNDPGQRFPFSIPRPGATGIWPEFLPIASSPGFKTDNVLPYAEHFNFTLQREISNSMILTMAYVGTRGHHLIAQTSSNPGNASRCLQIRQLLGPDQGCGPNGEDQVYDLNGDGVYELGVDAFGTRPYSITSGRYATQGLLDFLNNTYETTIANSNYNSLQISLEKRLGALRLLGAYTWSKSLDNASGFNDYVNPYNPRVSKSLSAFDMTHNFVVSYSYDLPFQKLAKSGSGPLHKFLDGWQIAGITRFTTGLPITLSASGDRSLCGCGGVDRPNYDGQPISFSDPRSSADHAYFSTGGFSTAELGVVGNANRRFFHGPGLNNWDFGLHKLTRMTERTSIEFRAEFFNVFNHAQFGNPSGTVTSSRFGQVGSVQSDPRIGQLALKISF
ncbi:MAG: carboxypeptidase regulatory-like domain-containing protein [Terriglobia bacterium]